MDKAHREVDRILAETLKKLTVGKFDELNLPEITVVLSAAQRVRRLKKEIDKLVDDFTVFILAMLTIHLSEINSMAQFCYSLNTDYMSNELDIESKGTFKTRNIGKGMKGRIERQTRKEITKMVRDNKTNDDIQKRLDAIARKYRALSVTMAKGEATRAENQARLDVMFDAEKQGQKLIKVWNAILDLVTRDSHRKVNKEKRPLKEKFSNGCRFPGDPDAPLWEVVNCRCWLTAEKIVV